MRILARLLPSVLLFLGAACGGGPSAPAPPPAPPEPAVAADPPEPQSPPPLQGPVREPVETAAPTLPVAAPEPAADPAEPGPHAVLAVARLDLDLPGRDDPLQVRVTVPDDDGPHAVIVWSHGANGSKNGYQVLARHWASHGFAVIQPTHGDSLSLLTAAERRRIRSVVERTRSRQVVRHWRTRPADVAAVLDRLEEIARAASGRLDRPVAFDADRVGVGGHSYGALTTQLVAGTQTRPVGRQGRRFDLSDDRPLAFLAISPQGEGGLFDEGSFGTATRPILYVTGSQDTTPVHETTPEDRRRAFEQTPPGDAHLLWIEDAAHGFGGIAGAGRYPGRGPAGAAQVRLVLAVSTAWWTSRLRGDRVAGAILRDRSVLQVDGVESTLTSR